MFYLYFSLFNKNIHEVKNIAIRIVSCHTYRDTYRIVKMCIVTSLPTTLIWGGGQTHFGSPTLSLGAMPRPPSPRPLACRSTHNCYFDCILDNNTKILVNVIRALTLSVLR